jgi:hypothetical protein
VTPAASTPFDAAPAAGCAHDASTPDATSPMLQAVASTALTPTVARELTHARGTLTMTAAWQSFGKKSIKLTDLFVDLM